MIEETENQLFWEFEDLNVHSSTHTISCGLHAIENPVLTKSGRTQGKNPKQMVRCMSNGKSVAETSGTLSGLIRTSPKDAASLKRPWKKSVSECAALINLHERTANRTSQKSYGVSCGNSQKESGISFPL